MDIKSPVMRNIAGFEIDAILPEIDPTTRREYVTSVVRQWITNAGHAGIFTDEVNYWLHLIEREGTSVVERAECQSTLPWALTDSWKAVADELPEILHRLSLSQSATFLNTDGLTVLVRALPAERTITYREAPDQENDLMG